MSDLDELKLKYTEENPDKPSDDVETIAFHSTPRRPKPAPKAVGPKRAKAEPPRKAAPLTMGVPRGVPTPNEASAALWLAALALAVVLAATRAAAVVPFLAIAVILALGTLMHPVTAPVLHDMERRFGLTVVDVSAGGACPIHGFRGATARGRPSGLRTPRHDVRRGRRHPVRIIHPCAGGGDPSIRPRVLITEGRDRRGKASAPPLSASAARKNNHVSGLFFISNPFPATHKPGYDESIR